MLTIEAYDRHVEQLFETMRRMAETLSRAGIDYRVIGGVAVYLHVLERDPLAASCSSGNEFVRTTSKLFRISPLRR